MRYRYKPGVDALRVPMRCLVRRREHQKRGSCNDDMNEWPDECSIVPSAHLLWSWSNEVRGDVLKRDTCIMRSIFDVPSNQRLLYCIKYLTKPESSPNLFGAKRCDVIGSNYFKAQLVSVSSAMAFLLQHPITERSCDAPSVRSSRA